MVNSNSFYSQPSRVPPLNIILSLYLRQPLLPYTWPAIENDTFVIHSLHNTDSTDVYRLIIYFYSQSSVLPFFIHLLFSCPLLYFSFDVNTFHPDLFVIDICCALLLWIGRFSFHNNLTLFHGLPSHGFLDQFYSYWTLIHCFCSSN